RPWSTSYKHSANIGWRLSNCRRMTRHPMADGAVRVLLIEDDDDDYVLAKDLFRELPRGAYHLDRVADYTSALEALEAGGHDVYLIDYRLGQRTGLELIEEARRRGS